MHGQGRSTFATGDATRFQNWLREQLEGYNWSLSQLAREIGVSKGAVVRWLADPEEGTYRRPAYESVQSLAKLFGTDMALLLEYAGIADSDHATQQTPMQREAAGIVASLPDVILAVVYPQLQALAEKGRQDKVVADISKKLDGAP